MSDSRHPAILVGDFPLRAGTRFHWHDHPIHQLAWAASGVVHVTIGNDTWVLPPARALWIPAGVLHSVDGGPAVMRAVYLDRGPAGWRDPTVIAVGPLLRELINYLAQRSLAPDARRRAEAVMLDLLEPVSVSTVQVPMPVDPRALHVARALVDRPGDDRPLESWGREVGASGRTLARLFAAETGMSFGRWRSHVRLRAALDLLAAGTPVSVVSHQVGYSNPSAFVSAFRAMLGVTPGAYFQRG
jgi:AraC-like DNA-binding protein